MRVKIILTIGLAAILAALGLPRLASQIYAQTIQSRALPNMMALAAAVQRFQVAHGRLPSPIEFGELRPNPDFKTPFSTSSPETQPSVRHPDDRAGNVTDPLMRPFIYETVGDTFLIRSLGPDGVPSDDDFSYSPKKS